MSPNSLATHLGCTRQNIAGLTAEAIIEQRSDGCYDQTASRLKYIKHLREQHRHTPRSQADAEQHRRGGDADQARDQRGVQQDGGRMR